MKEEILRSRITGRAQVVFGGAIQVGLGTVAEHTDVVAVGLSEFKHPAERAGEEPPSQETFGVQVSLVFPDLETLDNFRGMLDELEGRLKEKIMAREAEQATDFDDTDPHHLVHRHEGDEEKEE